MYIKEVMTGVNYLNKSSLRLATCKGYALAVERLFLLRNVPSPVDFTDETNWTKTIVHKLEREENVSCQRKPLDNKIHAQLITQANGSGVNSLEASVAEVVTTGKVTGWRASKHSQTKFSAVDYHEYPNKKLVIKAINGLDIIFSDEDSKIFQVKKKSDLKRIHAVVITWRHQKNRQNGQKIRLLVDRDHPVVCPALSI